MHKEFLHTSSLLRYSLFFFFPVSLMILVLSMIHFNSVFGYDIKCDQELYSLLHMVSRYCTVCLKDLSFPNEFILVKNQ